MKRKAILVGAPGGENGTRYLFGVRRDLINMKKFLLSAQGGAWKKDEVTVLFDPGLSTLWEYITSVRAHYNFIYFSGHGYTGEGGERMLRLRDCSFSDSFFLNSCPRQMIIIDAGRRFIRNGKPDLPVEEDFVPSASRASEARACFDHYIVASPRGKTIVHASRPGKQAFGDACGGYFTQSLLHIACGLKIRSRKAAKVSLEKVLGHVPSLLEECGQAPFIHYIRGNLQVPLGISISDTSPARHIRKNEQEKEPSSGEAGIWLTLGLLAIVLLSGSERKS